MFIIIIIAIIVGYNVLNAAIKNQEEKQREEDARQQLITDTKQLITLLTMHIKL